MSEQPWTVRRLAEAYWAAEERRDVEAVLALYHPDATYVDADSHVQGAGALREWYQASVANYPRLSVQIVREFLDIAGGGSAIEFFATVWDQAGQPLDIRGVNVFQVVDERFTSVPTEDPPAPRET